MMDRDMSIGSPGSESCSFGVHQQLSEENSVDCDYYDDCSPCLNLSCIFRIISITGIIAGLLCANIFENTTINCKYTLVQQESDIQLYDFVILTSVKDLWKEKSYGLSLLICTWSGIFPWMKVGFLMSAYWMTYPQKRDLLSIFTLMGKWALVDFYVLVLFKAIFQHTFDIANIGSISLEINFLNALRCFILVMLIVMYCTETENSKIPRRSHWVSSSKNANKVSQTLFVLNFISLILLIWSFWSNLATIKHTMKALLGTSQIEQDYSLIDVFKVVAKTSYWFEVTILAILVIILPIFLSITLTCWAYFQFRWITLSRNRQLFKWSHFLLTWSSLDVFMISFVVMMTEIHRIPNVISQKRDLPLEMSSKAIINPFAYVLIIISVLHYCSFFILKGIQFQKYFHEWDLIRMAEEDY